MKNQPTTEAITEPVVLDSFDSYGGADNQWHMITADGAFTGTMIESKYFAEQSNDADDAKTPYVGSVATVNSQTELVLSGSPNGTDDYYNGMSVVVYDGTNVNASPRDYLLCTDYVGSTGTLTLDAAPNFTIEATDLVYIYPDPKWRNQGMRVRMQLANLLINGGGTATGGVHLFGNYNVRNVNIIGVAGQAVILDRGNGTNQAGRYFSDFDFEINRAREIHVRHCDSGILFGNFADAVYDGDFICARIDGGTGFGSVSDVNMAPTAADGIAYHFLGGSTRMIGALHSYGTGYGARLEANNITINEAYLENCAGAAYHNEGYWSTVNHIWVHTASMWIDEPIVYSNRPVKILSGQVALTDTTGHGEHEPPGCLIEGLAHGSQLFHNIKLADTTCTGLTITSDGVHYKGYIYADTLTEGQVGVHLIGVNDCDITIFAQNIHTAVKLENLGTGNRIRVVRVSGSLTTPVNFTLAGEGWNRPAASGAKNEIQVVP